MGLNFGRKKKVDESLEIEEDLDEEETRAGPLAPRNNDDDDDDDTIYEAVDEESSGGNGKMIAMAVVLFLVAVGGAYAKGYVNIPGLPVRGAPSEVAVAKSDEAKLNDLGGKGDKAAPAIGSTGVAAGSVIDTANLVTTTPAKADSPKTETAPQPIVLPTPQPQATKPGPTGLVKEAAPPIDTAKKISKNELLKQRLDSIDQARAAAKKMKADSIKVAQDIIARRRQAVLDSTKLAKAEKAEAKEAARLDAIQARAEGVMDESPSTPAPRTTVANSAGATGDSAAAKPVRKRTPAYTYDDPRAPWNQEGGVKKAVTRSKPKQAELPYDDPNAPWNKDGIN